VVGRLLDERLEASCERIVVVDVRRLDVCLISSAAALSSAPSSNSSR